ncbi:MAG: hypothetical protein EOO38_27360, partial [Cytophagaceae bacterium]
IKDIVGTNATGRPSPETIKQIRESMLMFNEEKEDKLKPILTPEQWQQYQSKKEVMQKEIGGEIQRYLEITKMRGTAHCREAVAFEITERGIEVFAPRIKISRSISVDEQSDQNRLKTGIRGLDLPLGLGIPRGSSVLITGSTGSGKSLFGAEFLYRGLAEYSESGLLISYGETKEKILATARVLGWDLQTFIDKGTLKIILVPLSEMRVEQHLQTVQSEINRSLSAELPAASSTCGYLCVPAMAQEPLKLYEALGVPVKASGVEV